MMDNAKFILNKNRDLIVAVVVFAIALFIGFNRYFRSRSENVTRDDTVNLPKSDPQQRALAPVEPSMSAEAFRGQFTTSNSTNETEKKSEALKEITPEKPKANSDERDNVVQLKTLEQEISRKEAAKLIAEPRPTEDELKRTYESKLKEAREHNLVIPPEIDTYEKMRKLMGPIPKSIIEEVE